MAERTAEAVWQGNLRNGKGNMRVGSGAFEGPYSYASRFEDGTGTNPEELIAAAHAGCFSMALSAGLTKAGYEPTRIETRARVFFEKGEAGFRIARIQLETSAEIPNIDTQTFQTQANEAKSGCPVSKALAAVPIDLKATLK